MLPASSIIILSVALSAVCTRAATQTADVITSCVKPNTVALTFDDGPYDYLHHVVNTIESAQEGAKVTFFFNGQNWRDIYAPDSVERVKYAFNHGFQIGSHTWAHKHLTTLTRDEINSEMARLEDAVVNITGSWPAFTRVPYGEYNSLVLKVAASHRQLLVNWDFDSGDSLGISPNEQKWRYDEVIRQHPSNILSLQHEVHDTSVYDVLPYAVDKLVKAGYKLVTVADCLGLDPYLPSAQPDTCNSWQPSTKFIVQDL